MKKIAALLIAALLLALAAPALAAEVLEVDEPYLMYAVQDDVKVYAKHSTKSDELKKLKYNEEITVEWETDDDKWCAFTFTDRKTRKDRTGWVLRKYLTETPLCDHDWTMWSMTVEPTCISKGERTRYCKLCGLTESEEVDTISHEFGDWRVIDEPSCLEEGEKKRVCKVCGETEYKVIKKLPHEYDDWTVVRDPTCTKAGLQVRVCVICDHEDEEEIEKLPHEFGDWVETVAPSCIAEGEQVRECEVCGYQDVEVLEKLPHRYGAWEVRVKTTDHSAGKRAKVCQVCGDMVQESFDPEGTLRKGARGSAVREIQQLLADQGYLSAGGVDGSYGGGTERALMMFQKDQGLNPDGIAWPQTQKRLHHEFGEWQTETPLTRATDGVRVRVCRDCGYEQREVVPAGEPLERWSRGEGVRTVQKMLAELGYSAGTADGVYGPKLDAAFGAFAANEGLPFIDGRLMPADLDALVNAWIQGMGDKWMGAGDRTSPVNLMLTITPAEGEDGSGDMRVFDMKLTNLGSRTCRFDALLVGFGDGHDFTHDNIAVIVDGFELRANGTNTMTGRFSVADAWGEGALNVCAIATLERTGEHWLSNVRVFEESE
ncbi:MAG: peptidoglycan-binding protein [Clostridia bacterium]|nr:peptidoglycan-binding protein [Clostridia bacterium]